MVVRVECFMLADGAQEAAGKLYVLGGAWDTLTARSYPTVFPTLALVIKLAVGWNETNRPIATRIDCVDEDGVSILGQPMQGTLNVGRPPQAVPGDEIGVRLAITFNSLQVPRAGRYAFILEADGEELARTGFRAVVSPQQG